MKCFEKKMSIHFDASPLDLQVIPCSHRDAMMFPGMAGPRPAASRPAAAALPVGRIDNAAAVLVSRPEWAPPRLETQDRGLNRGPLSKKKIKFDVTQQTTYQPITWCLMRCNSTGLLLDGLEKPVAVLNDVSGMYQQHGKGLGDDGNMELPLFSRWFDFHLSGWCTSAKRSWGASLREGLHGCNPIRDKVTQSNVVWWFEWLAWICLASPAFVPGYRLHQQQVSYGFSVHRVSDWLSSKLPISTLLLIGPCLKVE